MKINLAIDLTKLGVDDETFQNNAAQIVNQIVSVINGQVSLTDNCATQLVSVTFQNANVQQAIAHRLGRIPQGYIQVGARAATQVYNGSSANTPQALYVQSTVATTVSLLIF
jgi:hypothetical protein